MSRAGLAALLGVLAGCGSAGGPGIDARNDLNGLRACAIAARPSDPTNPEGGAPIDNGARTCSTITTTTVLTTECLDMVDGGLLVDGGSAPGPAGGQILDGDYQLVRYQNGPFQSDGSCIPSPPSTSRKIRVFGGGTYFEWAATNRDSGGGDTYFWYDTTMSASGHTLSIVSWDCGASFGEQTYGYTASGDQFAYFRYTGGVDIGSSLNTVATYQRTCAR